ncbi:thioredoxin domain-containing protein [Antrihabitans sp. YC3-6]|uniref:Thioredoxin domain-containing protein n=1 Tax=Antrihabitans stalagmiti TaxID=2799499 RepID=A0A934NSI3_9NOCA|nr:thioredoxin domain-containing protein [Antrihabitans stalagmiti]MBJ8340689.1 thioredoxin domain-containing protein [Antrihabitans stalagmiti]
MNTKSGKRGPLAVAARKDRNRKIAIQAAIALVLVALVVAIGISVSRKSSDNKAEQTAVPTTTESTAAPSVLTPDGAIRIGDPAAKVVVSAIEDFQCPACKQFESMTGPTLSDLVASGTVAVDYSPIAILDRMSSTNYSTRAANAGFCVVEADKAAWPAWHQAMFEAQPKEGGAGLTDDRLVELATAAGASDPDVAQCITSIRYGTFVGSNTQTVLAGGVSSTPTIRVNGVQLRNPTPDALRAAVTAAAAQQ